MLDDMSYVSIFFRIFNFGITIAIFTYIFKNYIRKNIIQKIKERLSYLSNISAEKENLELNIENTRTEISQQDKLAKNLLKNLDKWRNDIEYQNAEKLKEYDLIKAEIENKQLIKNNSLSQRYIYKLVMPDIIETNRLKILEDFAEDKEAQNYQKAIIKFIKKGL